jgi:hypothetical protein
MHSARAVARPPTARGADEVKCGGGESRMGPTGRVHTWRHGRGCTMAMGQREQRSDRHDSGVGRQSPTRRRLGAASGSR